MTTLPINQILLGDCIEVMRSLPDASIDAIVSDPPYPEISRDYGRMSEEDWMAMMIEVVKESRRILKPTGSAVFILQPNSRKVGSMRLWLWKFMVWCGENWNIVQDVYWWNYNAMPSVHCQAKNGLTKVSAKPCVWIGDSGCYRNQDEILIDSRDKARLEREVQKNSIRMVFPSGYSMKTDRCAQLVLERGGIAPSNVIPLSNSNGATSSGVYGHGAGTPQQLMSWWIRYICPPNGVVLDPFMGAGTAALAAIESGRSFVGIEKMEKYHRIATERINTAKSSLAATA